MGTAAISTQPVCRTRLVARFAWITLGYFILVVLWGAVVRATGSGGGCGTHWPLCNGDFFPSHPRLATVIEFTHRSTSGICTFLTAALAFWTFRRTGRGHPARKAVLWAVFFLITEALLGAALVLRHWVENNVSTGRVIAQSVHFTNTLLLMGALALTAWFLRDEAADVVVPRRSKTAAWTAVGATLLVGATGSLAALADTLFPSPNLAAAFRADFTANAPVLIRMRWLHPAAAIVAFVAIVVLIGARRYAVGAGDANHPVIGAQDYAGGAGRFRVGTWLGLDRLSLTVVALLASQFVLGSLDVLLLAPTWMQVLHLLGADLYWIALVVLAGRVIWGGVRSRNTRGRLGDQVALPV